MGAWNSVIRIARPDPNKLPRIETDQFSEKNITLSLQQAAQ
jgi:hypothetical protein